MIPATFKFLHKISVRDEIVSTLITVSFGPAMVKCHSYRLSYMEFGVISQSGRLFDFHARWQEIMDISLMFNREYRLFPYLHTASSVPQVEQPCTRNSALFGVLLVHLAGA
jgi:hypothetical protein